MAPINVLRLILIPKLYGAKADESEIYSFTPVIASCGGVESRRLRFVPQLDFVIVSTSV